VTRARIRLTGIAAEGRHGARPGEKDEPQPFVVDLELEVDVAADAIDATADYRSVTDAVRAVIAERSHDLIEALADDIGGVVLAMPHVVSVTATVHKPNAATRLGVAAVSATVTVPERP
jgi:dihydroneopterin aldolase